MNKNQVVEIVRSILIDAEVHADENTIHNACDRALTDVTDKNVGELSRPYCLDFPLELEKDTDGISTVYSPGGQWLVAHIDENPFPETESNIAPWSAHEVGEYLVQAANQHEGLCKTVIEKQERINRVYSERSACIVALARTTIEAGRKAGVGEDSEGNTVVYVDTPNGQVSWHVWDCDHWMLEDLPEYEGEWDGTFKSRELKFSVWDLKEV